VLPFYFTAHSVPTRTIEPSEARLNYHGMILATGPDSYADDCKDTVQFVAEELKDILSADDWYFAFQPRHEWRAWIGPTVEDTLLQLRQGMITKRW
jgi:protoheme ferro-lyase